MKITKGFLGKGRLAQRITDSESDPQKLKTMDGKVFSIPKSILKKFGRLSKWYRVEE